MKKFSKVISAVTASAMMMTASISTFGSITAVDAADNMTAIEIVNDMGLGWNLGNTFDAWSTNYKNGNCPSSQYETMWGNVATTQEMISEIHKYGFNSVRIPVTFYKCTDPSTYTISEDYLKRVKQVAEYCTNEGMYAIIDMHWDWVDPSNNADLWLNKGLDSETQFKTMWKQIANYFKDCDQHVVFQDMNEVWWSNNYTSASSASYTTLNTLNQDFVDTVRATGGNNADRLLVLAGANADLTKTISSSYKLPDDDMVAVDVHYYTPSEFCVRKASDTWGTNKTTWGTSAEKAAVVTDFNKLKSKFIDNGTPVIIGEYGVLTDEGKEQASIEAFVETVAGTAYSIDGMAGFLWDDSDAGGHKYFSRKNLQWWNSNIGDIFSKISNTGYVAPTIDWVEAEVVDDNGKLKFQIGNSTRVKLVFESPYAKTLGGGGTLSYWDTVSNSNKQNAAIFSISYNEMSDELLANELGEEDADKNRPVVNTGYISIPADVSPVNAYIDLTWAGYNEMNGDEWVAWHNLKSDEFPTLVKVYIDGVVETPDVTTTTTTTTSTESDALCGDANCDGKVDLSDAVMILQALSNKDKYGVTGSDPSHITEQGMINADCNKVRDGVTTLDALTVQRYVVNLVESLPID